MNTYILHWLDGDVEEIQGDSFDDAWSKAGYTFNDRALLDYYETIHNKE